MTDDEDYIACGVTLPSSLDVIGFEEQETRCFKNKDHNGPHVIAHRIYFYWRE